jgi:two-component sensor histidine kinase
MHDLLDRGRPGVDSLEYVRSIARSTLEAYGRERVSLTLQVEEVALSDERSMLCGLILNELVSNALKHAFPGDRAGAIHIGLAANGDHLTLTVRDDGVGIGKSVDVGTPTTLGLRIVGVLARQLGGDVQMSSDRGAEIRVTFPRS